MNTSVPSWLRSRAPAFCVRSRRRRLICLIRPSRSGGRDDGPRLVALVSDGRPPFLRRLALYRPADAAGGAPRAA